MRRGFRGFLGTALCLCLASALAVAAPPAGTKKGAEPITVGDFMIELARAMNVRGPAGLTAEAAAKSLGSVGVRSGSDLNAALTEGELVRILAEFGVSVRTADPRRAVSTAKAQKVVTTFRGELTRAAASVGASPEGSGGDDFNNGNGKGGKFKRKANLSPGVPPGQTD